MRIRTLGVALLGTVVLPAIAALESGAMAPSFKTPAALDGREFTFSLEEALQKGPVVVYFYPGAFTGGCNLQAHTFSVKNAEFAAAGATIIGVSQDDIATLKEFSADPEYCAGKVAVASDVGGSIAKAYDLRTSAAREGMKDTRGTDITHAFTERTTFVIGTDGRIAAIIGGVRATENVDQSLRAVQQLAGSR